MNSCKIIFTAVFVVLLSGLSVYAQLAENPQTYCNPLNLNYRFMIDYIDAREAADPVIVLFQDNYYLFASRSGGYWMSPDLREWELVVPTGLDVEGYAPAAIAMRDSIFFIRSGSSQIYKSGDPASGIWISGPALNNSYGDPALFQDDDGRLFMYYGLSNNAPIRGVELNPYTFEEIDEPFVILSAQADVHGWERRGDDNLLDEFPWIEGAWMTKENGKYYLQYAGPGTEFKTYTDGIYVSDSPTGPFEYAAYSPFDFKPTGFICGAGHGCTFKDKEGKYWHIGTMSISVNADFERRLGLFPVSFDEDGQIYCNTAWGDYPQYFPGIKENHADEHSAGMFLLSYGKYVTASSSLPDHGAASAVDEEVRTYWSARTGDQNEWLMIDLGQECSVEAVQINFAEINTNPDLVRGRDVDIYQQYILEHSTDGMNWSMLADKGQNIQDVPHDYFELAQPVTARYIRCSNVFMPGNGFFAIRDLRIFGNSSTGTITQVTNFTVERDEADGRDALIHWDPVADADGYIVYYGIAQDKLYNHYIVYDADSVSMHSLNHGVEYFFEVNAFDSGTDFYSPAGEFRSSESGDWDAVSTWAYNDGSGWIVPSSEGVPDASKGNITITDGTSITISNTVSVDQLVIESGGILLIEADATLQIQNGIGTDVLVEGQIHNRGLITLADNANLDFVGNGTYVHLQDGGEIPAATWRPESYCLINSVVDTAPSNGNQNFYSVTWNCPDQTGNESMKWNGNTIKGNINIENTGSARWQMCAPSSGSEATVTIEGDIVQTAGQFSSNGTGNDNTTVIIHHKGNINVTGGNFSVSRGSQGGTGTTAWYFGGSQFSIVNATTQNSNQTGAAFIFNGTGDLQSLLLDNVTYGGGGLPIEVDEGAVLDLGLSVLEGNGKFQLNTGSSLITANENGLNGCIMNTGTVTLSELAGYGFNGSSAQVTGSLIPGTVADLIIDNSEGVTLSKSVTVNGNLELTDGEIIPNSYEISYGPEGSLTYSGEKSQTSSDIEFPISNGPASLVIDNPKGVTLHASRTVKNVDLFGKLDIDTFTLTAEQFTSDSYFNFIITKDGGKLKCPSVGSDQILFPMGTTSYAPVWISNSGTPDEITVGAIKDSDDAPYGGRVRIRWDIAETVPGGGDYTLTLGWLSAHENVDFRNNQDACSHIYYLSDNTEAGSGEYTKSLDTQPRTLTRGGITELGAFSVGLFSDPAGVNDMNDNKPSTFELYQNFPNPFNPDTEIAFSLPEASHVKMVLYDIRGAEIATLINKNMNAGKHSVKWDAKNAASGIYICKLIAEKYTKTRKMMLIR